LKKTKAAALSCTEDQNNLGYVVNFKKKKDIIIKKPKGLDDKNIAQYPLFTK